ncbi:MAG: DUF4365 domain-containing protein [Actinobacteria bacterium]|nr:DUF4365 domain-containing protein [Actinomycetota bacterium]
MKVLVSSRSWLTFTTAEEPLVSIMVGTWWARPSAIGATMGVTDSWVAGREAVLAFERFCLDHRWVFHEVPGHADFGKDGYVDLVEASGAVTGGCFSVQIKGGRSRRRAGGYRIDASENNRRQWAASTLPVIGIVWDPDHSSLHWDGSVSHAEYRRP